MQGNPFYTTTINRGSKNEMGVYDGAEVCELIGNFMLLTRTILDCIGMTEFLF